MLRSERGDVDLHSYLPIRRRPNALSDLTQVVPPKTERIDVAELIQGAVRGRLEGTEGVMLPSVEAAVLISLTTSDRDLIWEPFSNDATELCHFLDAYELLTKEPVNFRRFDEFVANYGLEDAVGTAYQLFERFFPTNPLARSGVRPSGGDGVLIQFVNGASGLWHREDLLDVFFRSFDERLERLRATQMRDGDTRSHRGVDDTSFDGVYEASTGGRGPARALKMVREADGIVLSLRTEKRAEKGDSVIVEAGEIYSHWYESGNLWGTLPTKVEYSSDAFTVQVRLPNAAAGHAILVGSECLRGDQKVVTAFPIVV